MTDMTEDEKWREEMIRQVAPKLQAVVDKLDPGDKMVARGLATIVSGFSDTALVGLARALLGLAIEVTK